MQELWISSAVKTTLVSHMPIANDGWYLIHCTNEACHNHYGMEIRENELAYVDFIEDNVSDEYKSGKIINLQEYMKEVQNGRGKNI